MVVVVAVSSTDVVLEIVGNISVACCNVDGVAVVVVVVVVTDISKGAVADFLDIVIPADPVIITVVACTLVC